MNKFIAIFIILIIVILFFNTSINSNLLEKSLEKYNTLERSLEILAKNSLEYAQHLIIKLKPYEKIIYLVVKITFFGFASVFCLLCSFKKRDIELQNQSNDNSDNNNDSSYSINFNNNNYSGLTLFNKFNQDIRTNLLSIPRVNINKISFGNVKLGEGYFGSVKKAVLMGHQVAIKTGNKCDQLTVNEMKCHSLLAGHKNILDIYGCFNYEMRKKPSFILELMDMNLHDYLTKYKNCLMGQHHTMFGIMYEIIDGIKYMHHNEFAHADLHPGNILVKNNASGKFGPSRVKISDFGHCKYLPNDTLSNTPLIGCHLFMSPEIKVGGRSVFEKGDDIYSLGVVVWVMFSYLAYGRNIDNLLNKFLANGVSELEYKVLPFNLENLIRYCMGPRNSRPTIQEFEYEIKMAEAIIYHYESMGARVYFEQFH